MNENSGTEKLCRRPNAGHGGDGGWIGLTEHAHLADVWPENAHDHAVCGGLARAVEADESVDAAVGRASKVGSSTARFSPSICWLTATRLRP